MDFAAPTLGGAVKAVLLPHLQGNLVMSKDIELFNKFCFKNQL